MHYNTYNTFSLLSDQIMTRVHYKKLSCIDFTFQSTICYLVLFADWIAISSQPLLRETFLLVLVVMVLVSKKAFFLLLNVQLLTCWFVVSFIRFLIHCLSQTSSKNKQVVVNLRTCNYCILGVVTLLKWVFVVYHHYIQLVKTQRSGCITCGCKIIFQTLAF